MKKLIIAFALIAAPLAFGYGQIDVSGAVGDDGYSVLRASVGVPIVPGVLSIRPSYATVTDDHSSTMSQFGLMAKVRFPFLDLVEFGAGGYYVPKANQYSNYSYDLNAAINLENLLFDLLPTDELKLGAGYRGIMHSFYKPDYDNHEHDIYFFLTQRLAGWDMEVNYTKAMYSDDTIGKGPAWLDIPYLTSVYSGYLDYSIGASTGYNFTIVRPYIERGIVKWINWPGAVMQIQAYMDCVRKHKWNVRWIAFIDSDEFITPISDMTLSQFLEKHNDASGIELNWLMYGSNGHDKAPGGLVIENFKSHSAADSESEYGTSINRHIKTIANPRKVKKFLEPHSVRYLSGHAVDSSGSITNIYFLDRPAVYCDFRINHYYTKSKEEFLLRKSRPTPDGVKAQGTNAENLFIQNDFDYVKNDTVMDKWIKLLKDN